MLRLNNNYSDRVLSTKQRDLSLWFYIDEEMPGHHYGDGPAGGMN